MTYGIIGLGYVGLPLSVLIAESGKPVLGFDISAETCKSLNEGQSHIQDVPPESVRNQVENERFHATTDMSRLQECDVISICVPTPLNKIKDPDLSYVVQATETIAKTLCAGQLILLESTTYPGTTSELMLPILESSGLKVGEDFFLCYSPERVDPGNKTWTTKNTPKVIGGVTDACLKKGINVYEGIFDQLVPVENTEAAELVKVYENTFRMVNIALANELSLICDKLGINVWDVIEAADTKPFGFMKFTPGPGLGGHCIPLDPHYLSWKMRTLSFKTRMIELASEINAEMPHKVVEKVVKKLNHDGKSIRGSKILILGVAYKKDVDDLRESPALDVMYLLHQQGAEIQYHDPYVSEIRDHEINEIIGKPLSSVELSVDSLNEADATLILTDHTKLDYKMVQDHAKVLIDTRGVVSQ